MKVLSGGDLGGQEIEWAASGTLPDGREYMTIDGFTYIRIGEIAVFGGMADA